jgi:type II secretory ATPase GspE/PulE/Tfp pilus assembly ATPase PilB-like protein
MIGEIQDNETAETAIRAALTGHLVLTTLHSNDAIGTIPRLKDIGPDPGLISDALLGIIAQRLIRKNCPYCLEVYQPTETDLKVLNITFEEANPQRWRKGKGCDQCFFSGYLGRETIIELLNVDNEVKNLIYEGTTAELKKHLLNNNFNSFRLAAIEKVTNGKTTVTEIKRVLPETVLNFGIV